MILWFAGRWRVFCVISSLSGRRGQMESRLEPRQPGEAAVAASVRQEGGWHVVCAGMLFYVRLHQAASDVPVDWSFRRSVSQLFSNSDSSPKVHFKMQEFLLLSSSKRASAASLLSTITTTPPIIIIKHVLPIEFLNDFRPQWVYDLSILEPLCF